MSQIDEVLAANETYSLRTHQFRKLTPRPERKLAVLTCMDTRLSIRTMGLRERGRAHHPQCRRYRHRRRFAFADRLALPARHRGVHGHQPYRLWPHAHQRRGSARQDPEPHRNGPQSRPLFSTHFRTSTKPGATNCKSFSPIPGIPKTVVVVIYFLLRSLTTRMDACAKS